MEIKTLNDETKTLTGSIKELEEKLQIAEKNYNEQKAQSQERIVTIYEQGEVSYLDVLLESRSISEFLSNYYLLSEITKMDVELLENIEREKNQIETNKQSLEQQKEKLKTVRNNRERAAIVLENTKVMRNKYLTLLTEEEKNLQSKVEEYEKQLKEIEEDILLLTIASLDSEYVRWDYGLACTRIYKNNIRVWNEATSYFECI